MNAALFSVVVGNSVHNNDGDGVEVNNGSLVKDNVVSGNGGDGIVLATNGTAIGNNCRRNGFLSGGSGISAFSSKNRIEGNNVVDNDFGITVTAAGNLIIKNSAANSTTADYSIVIGNDVGPIGSAATATSPWANISY